MRKSVITYTCDSCGKKVDGAKELRTFTIVLNRRAHGWVFGDSAWADLCDPCEARLIAAVEPILGSGVVELRREPVDVKPKRRSKTRA